MSHAALAQAIVGTWQGTLPGGEKPRVVVTIGKTDAGALRGVFYRIDMNAGSIPLSEVTFAAPNVRLTAEVMDVSYTAELVDGKSMRGTWKQGSQSSPLTLTLVPAEASWLHEGPAPAAAMSTTADPAFEVATVKPSGPDAKPHSLHWKTRRFDANRYSVEDLIEFAYNVRLRQVEGGPAWMTEQRFDLTGEPDAAGMPSLEQVRGMVRKLLASRFGLRVNTVQRAFPVYVLAVGADAKPNVTRSDPEMNHFSGIVTKERGDGQMAAQFRYMTMPEFCGILMNFIPNRQIVDETGLAGPYDFTLVMPMRILQGGEDADAASPEFFHAVQAQLGLKLEAAKKPLEVVVVEHVEQPTAN